MGICGRTLRCVHPCLLRLHMCTDIHFHSNSRPMHALTFENKCASFMSTVSCSFMGSARTALLREPSFLTF